MKIKITLNQNQKFSLPDELTCQVDFEFPKNGKPGQSCWTSKQQFRS